MILFITTYLREIFTRSVRATLLSSWKSDQSAELFFKVIKSNNPIDFAAAAAVAFVLALFSLSASSGVVPYHAPRPPSSRLGPKPENNGCKASLQSLLRK